MFRYFRGATILTLALVAALSFIAPAGAQTPSGSIQFKIFKIGFIIGAGGGSGTLFYQGQSYPLNVGGVSLGATIGAASADMTGEVYNLTSPADIQGTYTAISAGIAIVGGGKTASLKNNRGVVIKVSGKQVGLKISLDLSGLSINLE